MKLISAIVCSTAAVRTSLVLPAIHARPALSRCESYEHCSRPGLRPSGRSARAAGKSLARSDVSHRWVGDTQRRTRCTTETTSAADVHGDSANASDITATFLVTSSSSWQTV
ncbi:hypothetical protein OH799_24195 [Nocardia sp. NBC_00881]|uniref:hypothetical protein n=1 Tax=Nocardia sp. NBC_00881 TaxID=2975995 RepID=UPI00386AF2DE|nr:hypothetical protein OH799_24195 [Nocardia sp. NBC_00881]